MPRSSMTLGRAGLSGASAMAASFDILEWEQEFSQGQEHFVLHESDQNDREQDRIDFVGPALPGRDVRKSADPTVRRVDDFRENDVRPRERDENSDGGREGQIPRSTDEPLRERPEDG